MYSILNPIWVKLGREQTKFLVKASLKTEPETHSQRTADVSIEVSLRFWGSTEVNKIIKI